MKQVKKRRWVTVVVVLLALFVLAIFFSGLISLASGAGRGAGNVAIVPIKGVILTSGGGFMQGAAVSGEIVQQIEDADANPDIRAILLEIDSPGGAPVASNEIATAIGRTNKTTVAWIRESGTSGAYWIASATDYIVADPLSITGSIGVIGSYLDFSGLLTDFNVSYERLVGGQYKDVGVPYRKLSAEEKRYLQKKIDLMHGVFKDAVAKNRHLSRSEIDVLATGEFFLGMEAKNVRLVDELGGKREALGYVERTLNMTAVPVVYERESSLIESILSSVESKFGAPKVQVSGMKATLQ
ncbi:MAG: signal peptide peptidase SppA [Nanoarchaeota archaeon]|nr:signal peptide peptidase SppA [Nanoarchaeota archaeon]